MSTSGVRNVSDRQSMSKFSDSKSALISSSFPVSDRTFRWPIFMGLRSAALSGVAAALVCAAVRRGGRLRTLDLAGVVGSESGWRFPTTTRTGRRALRPPRTPRLRFSSFRHLSRSTSVVGGRVARLRSWSSTSRE